MYDDKIRQIADRITPHVLFDNVEQAQEYAQSYRQPESAEVSRAIASMAENFVTYASRFGLCELLEDGKKRHHLTLISTLREAIREVANRYIEVHEQQVLAALPLPLPRRATEEMAIA